MPEWIWDLITWPRTLSVALGDGGDRCIECSGRGDLEDPESHSTACSLGKVMAKIPKYIRSLATYRYELREERASRGE